MAQSLAAQTMCPATDSKPAWYRGVASLKMRAPSRLESLSIKGQRAARPAAQLKFMRASAAQKCNTKAKTGSCTVAAVSILAQLPAMQHQQDILHTWVQRWPPLSPFFGEAPVRDVAPIFDFFGEAPVGGVAPRFAGFADNQ